MDKYIEDFLNNRGLSDVKTLRRYRKQLNRVFTMNAFPSQEKVLEIIEGQEFTSINDRRYCISVCGFFYKSLDLKYNLLEKESKILDGLTNKDRSERKEAIEVDNVANGKDAVPELEAIRGKMNEYTEQDEYLLYIRLMVNYPALRGDWLHLLKKDFGKTVELIQLKTKREQVIEIRDEDLELFNRIHSGNDYRFAIPTLMSKNVSYEAYKKALSSYASAFTLKASKKVLGEKIGISRFRSLHVNALPEGDIRASHNLAEKQGHSVGVQQSHYAMKSKK